MCLIKPSGSGSEFEAVVAKCIDEGLRPDIASLLAVTLYVVVDLASVAHEHALLVNISEGNFSPLCELIPGLLGYSPL
jgi:hypothetical protein